MRPMKVAIQGIAASYHHRASSLYFKEDYEIVECPTFKNVCERLRGNDIDYAVMAIENSIAGSILPNYGLIKDYNFRIIGEIYLPIEFHLLANRNVLLEDIRCVESHPMAIAQCSGFLAEHPEMVVVEGADTASVAKKIRTGRFTDRAAIAGVEAAVLYELEILKHNIEDMSQNYTRFLIIAKHCPYDDKANKSTISFELPNEYGYLSYVLENIAYRHANLTKIQSLPVPGKPNKYSFYLDMEWESVEEQETLLTELKSITKNFSVLGWYKKHEPELINAKQNLNVCLT